MEYTNTNRNNNTSFPTHAQLNFPTLMGFQLTIIFPLDC